MGRLRVVAAIALILPAAGLAACNRDTPDRVADPRARGTQAAPFPDLSATRVGKAPKYVERDGEKPIYAVATGRGWTVYAWRAQWMRTEEGPTQCHYFHPGGSPVCTSPSGLDRRPTLAAGWGGSKDLDAQVTFMVGWARDDVRAVATVDGRGRRLVTPAVAVPGAPMRMFVFESDQAGRAMPSDITAFAADGTVIPG